MVLAPSSELGSGAYLGLSLFLGRFPFYLFFFAIHMLFIAFPPLLCLKPYEKIQNNLYTLLVNFVVTL